MSRKLTILLLSLGWLTVVWYFFRPYEHDAKKLIWIIYVFIHGYATRSILNITRLKR